MANADSCYDIDMFVNIDEEEDKELLCAIGQGVLKDPVCLTDCGHSFCRNCITRWFKNNCTCPIDRKATSTDKMVPNWTVANLVNRKKVRCQKELTTLPPVSFSNLVNNNNNDINININDFEEINDDNNNNDQNQAMQQQKQQQQDYDMIDEQNLDDINIENSNNNSLSAGLEKTLLQYKKRLTQLSNQTLPESPQRQNYLQLIQSLTDFINDPSPSSQPITPSLLNSNNAFFTNSINNSINNNNQNQQSFQQQSLSINNNQNPNNPNNNPNFNKFSCSWKGQLQQLPEHEKICQFVQVKCPYEGCNDSIIRKLLDVHKAICPFRLLTCNYCNNNQIKASDFQSHELNCPERPISCELGCGSTVKRSDMLSHLKDFCPATLIECPCKNFGCNSKFKRTELQDHLTQNLTTHMVLMATFVQHSNEYERSLQNLQNQLNEERKQREELQRSVRSLENKLNEIYSGSEKSLFAIGGYDGTTALNAIERFDPRTKTWSFAPSMLSKRNYPAAAGLDGSIYVLGGLAGTTYLNTAERFNLRNNTWTNIAPLNGPRYGLAACGLSGFLFAMGGRDQASRFSTVDRYSPVLNKWEPVSSMSCKREGPGCVVVDGALYILGGIDSVVLSSVERYDPIVNKWITLSVPMGVKRNYPSVGVLDGSIYAIGGGDGSNYLSTAERYDPRTSATRWEAIAPMSTSRNSGACGVLDGYLYVLGGWDGSQNYSVVERYDPRNNRWETLNSMNLRHCGVCAVVI